MNIARKVTLRKFMKDDALTVSRLCNNIKIWNNVKDIFPHPYGMHDAEIFIDNCLRETPITTFAILVDSKLVGTVGLQLQKDIYKLSAELGYWIGEPYWGMGIATEAVKQITDYGINMLGLIRIYSGVFDFNDASKKVLEKAGYTLECIAKKAIIKNGKVCDGHRYAYVKY